MIFNTIDVSSDRDPTEPSVGRPQRSLLPFVGLKHSPQPSRGDPVNTNDTDPIDWWMNTGEGNLRYKKPTRYKGKDRGNLDQDTM